MRLLVAEDDRDLAEVLGVFLERNNFAVEVVGDGRAALDHGLSGVYDGIVLDVMMPAMDGIEVLRRLRDAGVDTPVMMLTAKGATRDRIAGFDAGADDYLPKPFSPDELLSRVRAMLRRRGPWQPRTASFGDLVLDLDGSVLSCGDRSVRLSRREFQVMELLMAAPGAVTPAEGILERVWGWDAEAEVNVVWVHVSNVRKKLASLGSSVSIVAIRGLGYTLREAAGD